MRRFLTILFMFLLLGSVAQSKEKTLPVILEYSDFFEIVRGVTKDTVYITGSTRFAQGESKLFADSAIWLKGEKIILIGHVEIKDSLYQLYADHVDYDIKKRTSYATGKEVVLISSSDSLKATGPNAYFTRDSTIFRMSERPQLVLNYPDSSRLAYIDADFITYESGGKIGYADGDVLISQSETEAKADRGIFYNEKEVVLLLGSPVARRQESDIKGDTLIFYSENGKLRKLNAEGNAEGHFKEPAKDDPTQYDISDLKAKNIEFNFDKGKLVNIIATDQAYSYYNPAVLDSTDISKNHISGDSLRLFLVNEELSSIEVIGGAEGQYIMGEYKQGDSGQSYIEDTVFYSSDSIFYQPVDSVISLYHNASVNDKKVSLTAASINYSTGKQVVTAFDDTTQFLDTSQVYIPVVLKDGTEELIGSYMEYSMVTEKGMILKSRSEFQDAYYSGKELYREEKNVFYVKNGIYTSCDQDPPHFHFWSYKMKIIEDDRAMARPVFMFIGKVPFPPFPLPYYIFPLKKGRHSGILEFNFGNFSRGGRYLRNVGYYWAPSEYWDLQTSFDYIEDYGLIYNTAFRYNLRYKFSGSVSGSYINESHYVSGFETRGKRWSIKFDHSHTFSPTFSMKASGNFISDKNYYNDYATDQNDVLNRSLRSQVSFSKRFGNTSLTATFDHNDEIDKEQRTDLLPSASLSFPSRAIFGSPSKNDDGTENKKWYHGIYAGYSSALRNYSRRTTDTTGFRSRREYLTINNSSTVSAPFKLFSYFKFNPSFRYNETWYRIFQTDQSDSLNIDASTDYRRYAYSASISSSTDLYGTVEPNLLGLQGLRHVLTPSVSFSWAPEIDRHDNIKSYTGIGSGGAKQKTMSFGLGQLFQAKVKSGDQSKKITLITLNSGFSYNFEATGKKLSNLSTSAQTSLLKKVNLSASWVHSLYIPGTDKVRWWSPYLESFSLSTTFSTGGVLGEYEAEDTENSLAFPAKSSSTPKGSKSRGWSLSLTHYYNESGRAQQFRKTHTLNYAINLNLTPNIDINYTQYYDFARAQTIRKTLTINRKLHCWEGSFSWVIEGSNPGFQFRINVISIPEIKYEKSESGIRDALF